MAKLPRGTISVIFVAQLERFGLPRASITAFLKDAGIDDPTIINVFAAADRKRLGIEGKIDEVVLSE